MKEVFNHLIEDELEISALPFENILITDKSWREMTARSIPSAWASCAMQVSITTEGTRVQQVSELPPISHPYTHLFQV